VTFPTIPTTPGPPQRVVFNTSTATTSPRTLPNVAALSDVVAGDLLIVIVCGYQSTATANAVWSGWASGWTEFMDLSSTTGMCVGAAYKFATGSDSLGQVTQAATITGHYGGILLCIKGAHLTTPPEASSTLNQGTSTIVSLPSLNPTGWDNEETLWIAIGASGEVSTTGSYAGIGATPPNNFSDLVSTGISADAVGGVELAVAFRQNAAVSDGGTSGWSGADTSNARNAAGLIAVRPAAPGSLSQAAYRFYADGTESGSTALAAQDTAPTADVSSGDVNLGLRVRLQETNVGLIETTDDFQLEVEKNADGIWQSVLPAPAEKQYQAVRGTTSSGTSFIASAAAGRAQSFMGDGSKLNRAGFYSYRTGSPTGNVTLRLHAHSGTFGSGGTPGAVLATSTSRDVTTIANTYDYHEFVFDGTYTLQIGTPYFITIRPESGAFFNNATDTIMHRVDNADSTQGNVANTSNSGSSWVAQTGLHLLRLFVTPPPLTAWAHDSSNLTDDAATTSRLTGGTGTFVAGKVSEDGLVDNLGLAKSNHTELLYPLTVKSAEVANADVLRFRVVRNSLVLNTYAQTPTINILKGAPPATADFAPGIPI
jgi:hypothetical protein